MTPIPQPDTQEFDVYVRLSLQIALLGNVGSNLAAVGFRAEGDLITLAFRFRSDPSEEDFEDADITLTEVMASFPETIRVDSWFGLMGDKLYLEGYTSVFCVKM